MTTVPEAETLNVWERVLLARNPGRPRALDYIRGMCDSFLELHGDRRFGDDQAIVGGPGALGGISVMLIGQQKGKDTRENLRRNFGMPHPEGYRKALRLMRYAEKFGFPVVTLIDTPGASPNKESEERGQANAIAENILMMCDLRTPIVSLVIGEGGSGGALAIGVGDRLLMMENAIYSVASPEACASILWRDAARAPDAARALRITAPELLELQIADSVVPEPAGGAHLDTLATITTVRDTLVAHLNDLLRLPLAELLDQRYRKYRAIGRYQEHGHAVLAG